MTDLSFYKGRSVFITGHTGFKGSWLSHMLLYAGADVAGYSLEPQNERCLFCATELERKMKSIIGDIRDQPSLKKAIAEHNPEVVFHLAAQPLVRLSYRNPVETYETNVIGTVNLLDSIRSAPSVRSVVNITTDKVYENREWLWGYRENENLCGYDPYSNSKSCSELVTYSFRNSFFNNDDSAAISTARSGNVIGGGDRAEDRIIPDCVRSAIERTKIVVRNPKSIRPYQHVLDCLSGYLLLAEMQYKDRSLGSSYNFGPNEGNCVTTGHLVDYFCSAWGGLDWEVQFDNGPHEANFLKLDSSKAKNQLGWMPKLNIENAVAKVVELEKKALAGMDCSMLVHRQIQEYCEL